MIRKRQSGECRRYSRKPDSDKHRREALGYGRGRESPGRFPALRPRIPESLRKRFYTRLVLRLAVIQIVGVPFEGACFFN